MGALPRFSKAKPLWWETRAICIPAADVQRLILKDIAAALSLLL